MTTKSFFLGLPAFLLFAVFCLLLFSAFLLKQAKRQSGYIFLICHLAILKSWTSCNGWLKAYAILWSALLFTRNKNLSINLGACVPMTILQSKIFRNEVLIRTDYPDVHYWFRSEFITPREEGPPSGINLKLHFLEDQCGVVVDGLCLWEMRSFAKAIWTWYKCAPETWGCVNEMTAAEYHRQMCLRFEEFALCTFNWKSQVFATETYPNWSGRPNANRPRKAKTSLINNALSRVSASCTRWQPCCLLSPYIGNWLPCVVFRVFHRHWDRSPPNGPCSWCWWFCGRLCSDRGWVSAWFIPEL